MRMIAEGPTASTGVAAGFDERALAPPGACVFADDILTSLGPTLRRAAADRYRLLPPVLDHAAPFLAASADLIKLTTPNGITVGLQRSSP